MKTREKLTLDDRISAASYEELTRWFDDNEVPEWARISALFDTKVAGALSRSGSNGVQFLKAQLESSDSRKKHLALSALAHKDIADEAVVNHLVRAFEDGHTEWKQFALHCLSRVECYPLKRAEVEPLLNSPDESLGAEAMIYLSHAYPEEATQILRAGLQSSNPVMRACACTEASFRNIRELRPEVEKLSGDSDEFVARSYRNGIEAFEYAQMFGRGLME